MYNEWQGVKSFQRIAGLGDTWLSQMSAAAEKNGVGIQYCMSFPRFVMHSVVTNAVTQFRAGDDYHPGEAGCLKCMRQVPHRARGKGCPNTSKVKMCGPPHKNIYIENTKSSIAWILNTNTANRINMRNHIYIYTYIYIYICFVPLNFDLSSWNLRPIMCIWFKSMLFADSLGMDIYMFSL